MDRDSFQANTSFLLGKAHGTIRAIIDSDTDNKSKLAALDDFELELRKDIERLYYPSEILEPTQPIEHP